MRSSRERQALADTLYNIGAAFAFVEGMSFDTFRDDLKSFYAVTRALEIISEASRRLPEALKDRHPSIAWRDVASAGNIYRHEYEGVTERRVWATVHLALPLLRTVVEAEMQEDT